jgi:hypothetical protein
MKQKGFENLTGVVYGRGLMLGNEMVELEPNEKNIERAWWDCRLGSIR